MPANQLTQTTAPVLLLEREAELAALEAMLGAAQSGDGRLVLVEGSAGIGKTRLLAEARALAAGGRVRGSDRARRRAGGTSSRSGSCGSCSRRRWPLRPRSCGPSCSSGAAGLSASLFASAPTSASGRGAESSFAMLHGLYWLAANFASRTPTLLVVDDLHWADEPSLRWLHYLARRLEGLPLLLLVGTRPPEQANLPALVGELLTDPVGGRDSARRSRPGVGRRACTRAARESSPRRRSLPRSRQDRAATRSTWSRCSTRSGGKGSRRPPSTRRMSSSSAREQSRTASRRASPVCRPRRPTCCVRRRSSAIAPSSLSPPRSPGSSRRRR